MSPIGLGTWDIASRVTDQQTKYRGVIPERGNEAAEIAAIRYAIKKDHIDENIASTKIKLSDANLKQLDDL